MNSVLEHRVRTGPFTGSCNADWPGDGLTDRMRWASHLSWTPEYRFVGRLFVYDADPTRPSASGITFHPVHIDNCNNYFVRTWKAGDPLQVTWGKEVSDEGTVLHITSLPSMPVTDRWYDYNLIMKPNGRLLFYWDGQLIFDKTDTSKNGGAQFPNGGPVGMRLDYFDTVLDETRVYIP